MNEQVATTPWYQGAEGVDTELTAHLQNRGWDKLDVKGAAVQAALAHRNAEKLIGVPANQLLRLPDNLNDSDAMKPVYTRLGKPVDAKEYDFTSVKRGDKPLDDKTTDFLRSLAFTSNLSKDGALRLAQEFVKYNDGLASSAAAERTAALETEKAELKKNWGTNEAANTVVAKAAAAKLGVTEADLAALENVVGYARVMELFRTIGTKIGEDKFVVAPNGAPGVMTVDQAKEKKAELMRDEAWVTRYNKGDREALREMTALNTIIAAAMAA